MICPHCHMDLGGEKGVGFGVQKGAISSPDLDPGSDSGDRIRSGILPPKLPKRGKAREYTQVFEAAWKLYGRKEEKQQAFTAWLVASGVVGGEEQLLSLVASALKWQAEIWVPDGWKFAPYFERYLRKRRWDDEPAPPPKPRQLAARPAPYHAPTKPPPQLPAGTDAAAELERWRRERDQLADKKAAP
jgi:hypothetical protein